MKRKTTKKDLEYTTLLNAFIYSLGLSFGAEIVRELILIPFQEFSKIINSTIFLGLYLGALFLSNSLLAKGKFKTFVKYASSFFLIIYIVKFILTFVFNSNLFI